MISIKLSAHGLYLVWNASDARELRARHRIVGNLVGPLPLHPRQKESNGLPLVLMAEEVRFLVGSGHARLLQATDADIGTLEPVASNTDMYRKEKRRAQITANLDRIVEGKLRKLGAPPADPDQFRLAVQRELMAGIDHLPDEQPPARFWTTAAARPAFATVAPLPELEPGSLAALRYAVFEHFHRCGYFLTSGLKFGADFLAYDHDPLVWHAKFIIVCCEDEQQLGRFRARMAQAFGRLGKNVRKNVLVARQPKQPGKQLQLLHVRWNAD